MGGHGYAFSGNYGTKGCYAYEADSSYSNMAFYGTGGSEDEMITVLTKPKYRPIGHDCDVKGLFCFQANISCHLTSF